MKKAKNLTQALVFALTFFLLVALVLGVSGAVYRLRRTADGVISLPGGIEIDYTGFGKAEDDVWQSEQTTTFRLFSNIEMLPGDSIPLNSAGIKKSNNSIDFYTRIRVDYKFYSSNVDVTENVLDYSDFITAPTLNSAWVDSNNNDGWYYYAVGTTLSVLPSADYVDIFSSNPTLDIALNATGFNHAGGGYLYQVDENTSYLINRIEVYLTLEALQTTESAVTAEGWEIYAPEVVQNSSSQVTEILQSQITLGDVAAQVNAPYKIGTGTEPVDYDTATLGTTLKIIVAGDSQINAGAFENSDLENVYIGNPDYFNGFSGYSAGIYTGEAPTFKIGTNAFAGCSELDVYLSSSVNYEIYKNSLSGVRNVYYDGERTNSGIIKNPYAAGQISNTTITVLVKPNIVTGGTGVGSVNISNDTNIGEYTYTDSQGIWYFNLGDIWQGNDNGGYDYFYKASSYGAYAVYAQIRHCEMLNTTDSNQTLTIPSSVTSNDLFGTITVASVGGYYGWRNGGIVSSPALVSSIIIPSGVIVLDGFGFMNTTLNSIVLPDTITSISSSAFGDASFGSLTIPSSVIYIHSQAFYSCTSVGSIISDSSSITVVDNKFLIDNTRGWLLTSIRDNISGAVTIPSGVTEICDYAFRDCISLTSITIPNSVTNIAQFVFARCYNLTSITIGNLVTSIGSSAFEYCDSLTSITIPNSVTNFLGRVFDYCSNLTKVIIDSSTIAELDSSNSNLLDYATTVYVLDGLTVGDYINNWKDTSAGTVYLLDGEEVDSSTAGAVAYTKYVKNVE